MSQLSLFSILLCAFVSSQTWADATLPASPKPRPTSDEFRPAGGAADLLGIKDGPADPDAARDPNRIGIRCTDPNGNVLSEGQAGYEQCMADLRANNHAK